MMRSLRLHLFASVKGGVGKSTLAVAVAEMAHESGGAIVLDADFTGTSLADGLRLRAPIIAAGPEGAPDLEAPPTGRLLTVAETEDAMDLRRVRRAANEPDVGPFFLNDLLSYTGSTPDRDANPAASLWSTEDGEGPRFLPSSPHDEDARIALSWMAQGPHYPVAERMGVMVQRLAAADPTLTDISIDLPPGLFGLALHAMKMAAAMTAPEKWSGFPTLGAGFRVDARTYIVTSADRNALFKSAFEAARLERVVPHLRLVVNRSSISSESISEALRTRFRSVGIESAPRIMVPPRESDFGRLFITGRITPVRNEGWAMLRELLLGDWK